MIARLRRMDRAQRQMLASIGMNMLTRVPSVALVLVFLPRMRTGLGLEGYGLLFASLALGAAATFVIGGFATLGLRIIGEAHSRGAQRDEADGFVSLASLNLGAGVVMASVVGAVVAYRHDDANVLFVALLPILASVLNGSLDQTRLAYNEHYIVSGLGVAMQLCCYGAAFAIPAMTRTLPLAAFLFHGPIILASLISGALLLSRRRYLLRGRPRHARQILQDGFLVGIADGGLVASFSVTLIWLERVERASIVAWFATEIRLFQMFLTPILMIMLPLASFVRSSWSGRSAAAQRRIAVAALGLGIGGGVALAGALLVGGVLYARYALHLAPPAPFFQVLPLFAMFGIITAYKSYSSIVYLVLDGRTLARRTIAVLSAATLAGAATAMAATPLLAIAVFFSVATVLLGAVMVANQRAARPDRVAMA